VRSLHSTQTLGLPVATFGRREEGAVVARIPRGRRKAVLGGVVAAIVLGTAFMLYFVFREHFASAVIGVAGLIIGAASLLVGVVALFDPGTAQATGAATAINTGVVEGPQITAGHDVILEHNPNEYQQPEFPMTPMRRPDGNVSTPRLNNPADR
jgi:hypothetical protein